MMHPKRGIKRRNVVERHMSIRQSANDYVYVIVHLLQGLIVRYSTSLVPACIRERWIATHHREKTINVGD